MLLINFTLILAPHLPRKSDEVLTFHFTDEQTLVSKSYSFVEGKLHS